MQEAGEKRITESAFWHEIRLFFFQNSGSSAARVKEEEESSFSLPAAKADRDSSKYALASIANIYMNVSVLEPDAVDAKPVFFVLLRFIVNVLPELRNEGEFVRRAVHPIHHAPKEFLSQMATFLPFLTGEELVLCGNLSVLGLLLMRSSSQRPKATDVSTFKFVQAIVRFFWDAHNCDESPSGDSLVVASLYTDHWSDLEELWFLGMQILSSLLEPVR